MKKHHGNQALVKNENLPSRRAEEEKENTKRVQERTLLRNLKK